MSLSVFLEKIPPNDDNFVDGNLRKIEMFKTSIKILERHLGRQQFYGLKVQIRNAPTLFAVCTVRTPEYGEAQLPAVELKSSGTVVFEFAPPTKFQVLAGNEFLKGEIQFSLWKDAALREIVVTTEWEGWCVAKWEGDQTPGATWGDRTTKKRLESKYANFWTFESSAWKTSSTEERASGKSGSHSSSGSSSKNSKSEGSPSPDRNGKMTMQEALEILGLKKQASDDEVRLAYRNQIKKYHPDRVADLADEFKVIAESKTKMLNLAYEMLKQRA